MSLSLAIGLAFLALRPVVAQDVCSTLKRADASSQLGTACGSPVPVCVCNYRTEDQSLSQDFCDDHSIYCSGLDATSCGNQHSWASYFDDGTVTYGYKWRYFSGTWADITLISVLNFAQRTCLFQIIDNIGTSYDCGCEGRTCSADNAASFYIDCSGYSAGAYADSCLGATWGITSGVLEGWAIPAGLCNAGSNDDGTMNPADDSPVVKQTRGGVETGSGKIAGIVVGVLVVIVGFGVGVWYHRKHPENLASFVTSFFHGLMLGSRGRQAPHSTPTSPPMKLNEEQSEPSDSGGALTSSDSAAVVKLASAVPEEERTESTSSGR
jgi:hypothetical protein